ncbi:hypothetical protein KC901_00275 [Patescibacteria group bacterium]|nr:hypothetical protein [Patescibacteria group bacterium]
MKTYYLIKFGITYYRSEEIDYIPHKDDLLYLPIKGVEKIPFITLTIGTRHRDKINNNLYLSVELHSSKNREQGDQHRQVLCEMVISTWEPLGQKFPPHN